jgi:hypothetical protein
MKDNRIVHETVSESHIDARMLDAVGPHFCITPDRIAYIGIEEEDVKKAAGWIELCVALKRPLLFSDGMAHGTWN